MQTFDQYYNRYIKEADFADVVQWGDDVVDLLAKGCQMVRDGDYIGGQVHINGALEVAARKHAHACVRNQEERAA